MGKRTRAGLGLWLCVLAGCAANRPQFDQALLADRGAPGRNEGVVECYAVGCPDVLDVAVDGRPDLTGSRPVGPDGRIDAGPAGRLRVEGQTPPECARRLAELAGVPPAHAHVRVAEFHSQQIYLYGQVTGLQRAVAYRGPETVLDLLHRTGGITAGAAPNDVYVVRPHVAEGRPPQVFHINLRAILLRQDQQTNLRIQPFDEIYIGQTSQSRIEASIPPCLRPIYESVCGLRRSKQPHAAGQDN